MTRNRQTVREYMEAFNKTDHAGVLSCLADEVEWVMPGVFHVKGKDAFDKEIENDAFVGSPTITVARMIEESDVVMAEGTVRCARKDGGSLNAVFCDVFVMQDAKIRQLTSYLMEVTSQGGPMTKIEGASKKPAFELVIERVINAPRERVFEAWTKPEQIAQWFAPKPFKLIIKSMDFRPGGRFSMAMRGPNGEDFPFTGTYREIVPPSRLVWTGEFLSGPADQMTTVVTFEEQGRKTKLHVRQTFHVMTPKIEHATKGAKQGWTMTLDQLEEFCS